MGKLLLRIVTLDKICFEQEVDSVMFDVLDGKMGVLSGHAPFTVGLKDSGGTLCGVDGDTEHTFNIAGGFAKIAADSVIILTEEAVHKNFE